MMRLIEQQLKREGRPRQEMRFKHYWGTSTKNITFTRTRVQYTVDKIRSVSFCVPDPTRVPPITGYPIRSGDTVAPSATVSFCIN